MEKEPIKSPIQLEPENLEKSIKDLADKKPTDAEMFISAFLSALKGPEGKQGEKGEKGETYKLTDFDKKEIANIVYRIVEERMDTDLDEIVKDALVVIEAKLPERISKEVKSQEPLIKKIIAQYAENIKSENAKTVQSIKKETEKVKSDVDKKIKTLESDIEKSLKKFWEGKTKEVEIILNSQEASVIIEKIKGKIAWSDIKERPNIITGLAHLVDTDITEEPNNGQALVWNSTTKRWEAGAVSGGGGFTLVSVTGTIDDSNTAFTCATEPTYVVINGVWYQATGGVYTWSWTLGTLTLSGPIGTGSQIWAFA